MGAFSPRVRKRFLPKFWEKGNFWEKLGEKPLEVVLNCRVGVKIKLTVSGPPEDI